MGLWKKKWGAKRLMKEFPGKRRPKTSITRLLQKIDNYGTIERKSGEHNNGVIVTSRSIAVNISATGIHTNLFSSMIQKNLH